MEIGEFHARSGLSASTAGEMLQQLRAAGELPEFVCSADMLGRKLLLIVSEKRIVASASGRVDDVAFNIPVVSIERCIGGPKASVAIWAAGKATAVGLPNEETASQLADRLLRLANLARTSADLPLIADEAIAQLGDLGRREAKAAEKQARKDLRSARLDTVRRERLGLGHTEYGQELASFDGSSSEGATGRVVLYELAIVRGPEIRSMDKYVSAEVVAQGQKIVNYRPTLTRTIVAAAIPGPTAIFGLASRKKVTDDTRSCQLAIAHLEWQWIIQFPPDRLAQAQAMAMRINALAERIEADEQVPADAASSPVSEGPGGAASAAERLATLQDLVAAGLLSTDEFEAKRAEIIASL